MYQEIYYFRLFAIFCLFVIGSSIFEEQYGEFNWKIENYGYVDDVIYSGKKAIFVSEDALISQGIRSNSIDWRIVLPKDDQISRIVMDQSQFYTLDKKGDILRGWLQDGTLLWDTSTLHLSRSHPIPPFNSQYTMDLMVDTSREGILTVLANNNIYFLRRDGTLIFTYSPMEDTNQKDSFLVLSHLIPPPHPNALKKATMSPQQRLAIGCMVSSNSNICISTVLVTFDWTTKDILITKLPVLPVPPQNLYGSLTPYAPPVTKSKKTVFQDTDLLFAVSGEGTNKGSVQVIQLSTGSTTSTTLPFQTIKKITLLQSIDKLTTTPVILHCHIDPQTKKEICAATSLSVPPSQSNAVPTVTLQDRITCTGDSVAIGSERSPQHALLSSSISCARIANSHHNSSSSSSSSTSSMELLLQNFDDSTEDVFQETIVLSSTTTSTTPTTEALKSPLLSLFPQRFQKTRSHSSSASSSSDHSLIGVRSLLQYASGYTLVIQNKEVLWESLQSLAAIQSAVIVDRSSHNQNDVEELRGTDEDDASDRDIIPSFNTRLEMQFESLQQGYLALTNMVKTLPKHALAYLTLLFLQIRETVLPTVEGDRVVVFADRETLLAHREQLGKQFGFAKVAVCLSSRLPVDWTVSRPDWISVTDASVLPSLSLERQLGLLVTGLDLLTGTPIWTFSPDLAPLLTSILIPTPAATTTSTAPVLLTVRCKLLVTRTHRRGLHAPQVVLAMNLKVKGQEATSLAYWIIDVSTGKSLPYHPPPAAASLVLPVVTKAVADSLPSLLVTVPEVISVVALGRRDVHGQALYMLVHAGPVPVVSLFPPESENKTRETLQSEYLHTINISLGSLQTYQVHATGSLTSLGCSPSDYICLPVIPVATARLPPEQEEIVGIAYPSQGLVPEAVTTTSSTGSVSGAARATVLGDDSLLLKYLNPHMVAIVTSDVQDTLLATSTTTSTVSASLYVTVFDTISAKVIYRAEIKDGQGPVVIQLLEHRLFVSYWNHKAKRSELFSAALYEGMIEKYGLGPFNRPTKSKPLSAFTSYAPIVMSKTFILQRAVTVMHQTVTAASITNKNLLLAQTNNQVFPLDMRVSDPRRPLVEPTPAEREEGLQKYTPFIHPPLQKLVTVNATVPEITLIVTSPSGLESTSLVLVIGLDVLFNRVMPSEGFDLLASDFNYPLLVLTIVMLAFVVIVLRYFVKSKSLAEGWA